jgi:hypothetical protein
MEAYQRPVFKLDQEKIEDVYPSLKRKMNSQKTTETRKIVTVADLWRRLDTLELIQMPRKQRLSL